MQKPSDERLIAYLDGALAESEGAEIAAWLEHDPVLRERAARLTESAALLRSAFDEVLREPLPERLVAAAHGGATHGATGAANGAVVNLAVARDARAAQQRRGKRPWWMGMAAAASLFGLMVGGGLGYVAANGPAQIAHNIPEANPEAAIDAYFPDNLAGYYKRYVNVAPDDSPPFDKLPPNFSLPNLKPWGLEFQGARFLMVEGQPAMALLYTTNDKALGPIMVVQANTSRPDNQGGPEKRGDINVWRWIHHGHAYWIAGTANSNYLWNIHNDLSYQFDGI
jgi:anti-sigma factor RsiW